jgi:hypothetical protein
MDDTPGRKPQLKYLEPNHDRYKRSQKHEERLSKRLGGRRLPRSGGLPWSKWDKTSAGGDIAAPEFHFEHKRTDCGSISIPKDWLAKVSDGARRVVKDPGIIVTFEKKGAPLVEWVLIPLEVLERLLKKAKD